ncbi:MAG: TonB-dependent receptor plug domain-containing protein [Bacteroidetes bacterium]|nr:TonB-dependent receptor plug domain-containing protein [Bacteroidota bacterium]
MFGIKIKITVLVALFLFSNIFSQDTAKTSELFDLSIAELMDISVVTSAKWEQNIFETSSKVTVISEKEIKERGYHDLMDVFQSLPFFQIQSQQGHWTKGGLVNFQGLRSGDSGNNKILILIDGLEINDEGGEGIFLGLNSIPLNSVKQIEIVNGPNSTLYGRDAFGAMINIITIKESKSYAGYSSGTFNSQRIYGGVSHKFEEDIFGSINYFNYRSDEQDPTKISLAYKLREVFPDHPYTEQFYRASDNKYLGLKFNYKDFSLHYNLFDIDVAETYGSNPNLYVVEYSTRLAFVNQQFALHYSSNYNNLLNLEAEFQWKKNEFDPRTANLYTGDLNRSDSLFAYGGRKYYYFKTESYAYKIQNIAEISDKIKNVSGIELEDIRGIPVISEGKGGEPISTETQRNKFEHYLKNWGVFSEFNYTAFENLIMSFGGRIDHHSLHEPTFMPRVAFIYNRGNHLLRFTFSTGYIAPSVTQSFFESITTFSWIKPNTNLKAEKNSSHQFDWSYVSKEININAGMFFNILEDAIVESVTTGDSAFVNVGGTNYRVPILMSRNVSSGRRYGFSLSASKTLFDRLTASANYSLILGEDKVLNKEIHVNKNHVSNHKIHLGLQYTRGMISCYTELFWLSRKSIKSNHTTGKYAILSDSEGYINFDPVFLANANLRVNNILDGFSIYVRVKNIFDNEYYGQTINAQWGAPVVLQDMRRIDLGFDYEF